MRIPKPAKAWACAAAAALALAGVLAAGAEVSAGRNLSIVANGKDAEGSADTNQGDLTLRGATVTAKGDVSLIARRCVATRG